MSLWALRGATTVEADTAEQVTERVTEMVDAMMERNGVTHDDIVSIVFTATDDITSMFPATAARKAGLGAVPLICARELSVEGAMPLTIRALMHVNTPRERGALRHVYLHAARSLRDDLPE